MVAVPGATPVTTPVVPTVAIPVAVLDQLPPVAVTLSVMVLPTQTDEGPVIGLTAGAGFTVTTFVAYTVSQMLPTV